MDWSAIAERAVDDHGALQKPAELADLLALAAASEPKIVVEIGSDAGGTLWAWSQLAAEVVSVSLPDGRFSTGRSLESYGARVISGDSHDIATWLALGEVLGGRKADLLFVDGDHTYEGVGADVAAYTAFLRPGGLLALHDICRHPGRPEVGVWRIWEHLRERFESRELVHPPDTWGGIGVVAV